MAAIVLVACMPSLTLANGTPIRVPLTFQAGVSNFGPQSAVGLAEIVGVEGDVRVEVFRMPQLTADLYQLWLLDTPSNRYIGVGKFNTGADGYGRLDSVVDLIGQQFDTLLITVEPEPDPGPGPDKRITIVGIIQKEGEPTRTPAPVLEPTRTPTMTATTTPAATQTVIPTPTPTATVVIKELPKTGSLPLEGFILVGVLILAMGVYLISHHQASPERGRSRNDDQGSL